MQRSIQQISDLFRQGSLSPVELTEDCLARIEKQNPRLNAFITVTAESARRRPARLRERFAAAIGAGHCTAFLSLSKI